MNPLPSRGFTWHIKSYFLWKTMKKYLWMSPAAVVIGALRVNYKKTKDKIFICKFSKKKKQTNYIILRIQRLEGKRCRSRWSGSLWATSSKSMLFANSAVFVPVFTELIPEQLNSSFRMAFPKKESKFFPWRVEPRWERRLKRKWNCFPWK